MVELISDGAEQAQGESERGAAKREDAGLTTERCWPPKGALSPRVRGTRPLRPSSLNVLRSSLIHGASPLPPRLPRLSSPFLLSSPPTP